MVTFTTIVELVVVLLPGLYKYRGTGEGAFSTYGTGVVPFFALRPTRAKVSS